jgi:hypothetical protein
VLYKRAVRYGPAQRSCHCTTVESTLPRTTASNSPTQGKCGPLNIGNATSRTRTNQQRNLRRRFPVQLQEKSLARSKFPGGGDGPVNMGDSGKRLVILVQNWYSGSALALPTGLDSAVTTAPKIIPMQNSYSRTERKVPMFFPTVGLTVQCYLVQR